LLISIHTCLIFLLWFFQCGTIIWLL
jgi:hypothetical protein